MKQYRLGIALFILLFSLMFYSCKSHFFVRDSRFVRIQTGYLLLFEKEQNKIRDTLNDDKFEVASLFFSKEIDTSKSYDVVLSEIFKEKNTALELGFFPNRENFVNIYGNSLGSRCYYIVPVKISFVRENYVLKKDFDLSVGAFKKNISIQFSSIKLVNVQAMLTQNKMNSLFVE